MLFKPFGQVVDGGRHVGYAVFGEFGDVVVDNGARAYLQQRLGAVEGQRSEAFAAASGHEDCRQRQQRRCRLHIEKPRETSVGIDNRQKPDSVASCAAQLSDVGVVGAYPAERAVHDVGDAGLERHSAQQGAPYVAVGEGACQAPVGVGGKERHYAVVD